MTSESRDRPTALWWIRRDLRLENNQSLQAACSAGYQVQPVFILDEAILNSSRMSKSRLAFLGDGLRSLADNIADRGGKLIIRSGNPGNVLPEILEEVGATIVFAEQDYSPYARRRDQKLAGVLELKLTPGVTVSHPEAIRTHAGDPYQIYTPYMKKWKKTYLESLRKSSLIDQEPGFYPRSLDSESLPDEWRVRREDVFPPGEKAAQRHLREFTQGDDPPIYRYQEDRDRPEVKGTSRLSPYLHLGMISIRRVFRAALEAIDRAENQHQLQSAETWLEELIWREFYLAILYHHPQVLEKSFREKLRRMRWRDAPEDLRRWQEGRTGYPLVDAGMRQLSSIHWMHNRVRMVTASFLVKDLLIDWRRGEDWFMKNLVDADLAANNGGWQWAAGTGTDAAPYFRIFNPTSQAEKHDPQGTYLRRYVPELRDVPREFIHTPWKMPEQVQSQSGCVIGKDYPRPIVDHQEARERTLEAYQIAREAGSD